MANIEQKFYHASTGWDIWKVASTSLCGYENENNQIITDLWIKYERTGENIGSYQTIKGNFVIPFSLKADNIKPTFYYSIVYKEPSFSTPSSLKLKYENKDKQVYQQEFSGTLDPFEENSIILKDFIINDIKYFYLHIQSDTPGITFNLAKIEFTDTTFTPKLNSLTLNINNGETILTFKNFNTSDQAIAYILFDEENKNYCISPTNTKSSISYTLPKKYDFSNLNNNALEIKESYISIEENIPYAKTNIIFEINSNENLKETQEVIYGNYFISPIAPKIFGYNFSHWQDNKNNIITSNREFGGTLTETTITEYQAIYTIKEYPLKLNANGGNLPEGIESNIDYNINNIDTILNSIEPERNGWNFKGWNLNNIKGLGPLEATAQWEVDIDDPDNIKIIIDSSEENQTEIFNIIPKDQKTYQFPIIHPTLSYRVGAYKINDSVYITPFENINILNFEGVKIYNNEDLKLNENDKKIFKQGTKYIYLNKEMWLDHSFQQYNPNSNNLLTSWPLWVKDIQNNKWIPGYNLQVKQQDGNYTERR